MNRLVWVWNFVNEISLHMIMITDRKNGIIFNNLLILFGTHQRLWTFPATPSIHISDTEVELSDQITSLGVVMDSNLTFNAHITALCKACHFHLRSLRHIRRLLTDDMAIPIAVALVQSCLDYCNSFLTCHVSISISSSVSKILLPGLLSMIGTRPFNGFLLTCTGSLFKPELNLKFALTYISYFLKTNMQTSDHS